MLTYLIRVAAWLSLAAVVFVTVSPIGLRPHDVLPVNLDRALAFAVMVALFVLAYPRRWLAITLLAVVGAGAIELLQDLSPTRHARLADAGVKAGGALAGAAFGYAASVLCQGRKRRPRAAKETQPDDL